LTLIEYDNTQNDANHIHSVWHDLERNSGRDLLREHYAHGHAHGEGQRPRTSDSLADT
jgi:hypothetical protein